MPERIITQDKFNGTCDLTLTLSQEETRLWRQSTPAKRTEIMLNFSNSLGSELPSIATSLNQAVMPTGISETSRAAAKKAQPKFAGKVKTVYEAISRAERLGLTDEEAQQLLVMSGNSYRPARRALVKLGLVDKSGEHRLTRAGNNANIWVVIAKPADVGV